ncbi:Lrp/AsnC family transcriptional regulator [Candidatus Woesearchaeota archaeon]|nr:Lrp/AsnC family transcriptional regulator [Candidatus Woesearchaeota archaeon]
MEELSAKDKKILASIEFDARKTISRIAKEVNLSKEVTNYHLHNLESRKLISKYGTIFNLFNMGKDYYYLFLKINNLQKIKSDILIELKKIERMTKYDFLEGNFNLCLTLYSNSCYDLIKEVYPFINQFGKHITRKEVYPITDIFIKKCNFLYNSSEEMEYVHIKRTNLCPFSDLEKNITEEIAKNPKIQLNELKTVVKVDIKTLKKYILQLHQKKIIEFYRTYLDLRQLGYQKLLVFLYLYNFSNERRTLIENLLKQNNISSINICFGNADLLIDIHIKKVNEIYSLMSNLMNEFPEIVKDFEIFAVNESKYLK